MLADIDELTVVASDGPDRLTVWRRPTGAEPFALIQTAGYEVKFGTANSAALVTIKGQPYFVTGHENGHVLLWTLARNGTLQFATSFDLRSANPIPSPYPLHNIRSLVVWRGDRVISGYEDGDIVGLSLPDGRELFRTRFNQTAQRGINNLSLLGDWLLLSNCSVGQADKNIWLYDLSTGTPLLRDSENLVLDTQRPQVFNFDAVLVPSKDGPIFFSSTEEGLLWEGKIDGNQLVTTAVTKVASEGGAILRFDSKAALVAAAAYQIWLFKAQ
jgi:WD40 repeat protein